MTQELGEIRIKIDDIDNRVHDLLMERASLVSSVAAAKKKEGLQIVQPAREARMIRRLLKRHSGPLPQATIVRIWRELVGSVSLLQTGLNVAVAAQDGHAIFWDMARNYFGSAVPMKKVNGNSNTVSEVKADESSFGVLPWPEMESVAPWWAHLLDQHSQPISIICALPYGSENEEDHLRALVISKISFLPSDEDMCFIGLKCTTSISRAKLTESGAKVGAEPIHIYSTQSAHDSYYYYLLEVEGYIEKDSQVLTELKNILGEVCIYSGVVGGYPYIPLLKKPKMESGNV